MTKNRVDTLAQAIRTLTAKLVLEYMKSGIKLPQACSSAALIVNSIVGEVLMVGNRAAINELLASVGADAEQVKAVLPPTNSRGGQG